MWVLPDNVVDLINMQIAMLTQGLQMYSVDSRNLNIQDLLFVHDKV